MGWFERLATAHLDRWHGHGEAHQVRYFRCSGCGELVTWTQIRLGGCACGRGSELRPASLSRWEMFRCLVLPFTVGTQRYPPDEAHGRSGKKWVPDAGG